MKGKPLQMPTFVKCPITHLTVGQYVADISQQVGSIKVSTAGWISNKSIISELAAKGVVEVIVDVEKQLSDALTATQLLIKSEFQDVPFEDELPRAKKVVNKLLTDLQSAFSQIRDNDIFDLSHLHLATMAFIASTYRNPSAILCIVRATQFDDYQLGHALRTAAYYCKTFRVMHWPSESIQNWVVGAFLHDIGKLHMKQSIQQPHLLNISESTREKDNFIVPAHIEEGVSIAQKTGGFAEETIEVIQMHHERLDGSGYPTGQGLTDINDAMRIFTIIDELDRLMHIPVKGKYLNAIAAYQKLLKMEKEFDFEFIQQIIKSIGIYPPGSLVILKSGRVGIVLGNHGSTVKPDIKLIYDDRLSQHINVTTLSLSKTKETDEIVDFYDTSMFPDLAERYL
jgi:putative nucleotidyltransferase with HDIG domain